MSKWAPEYIYLASTFLKYFLMPTPFAIFGCLAILVLECVNEPKIDNFRIRKWLIYLSHDSLFGTIINKNYIKLEIRNLNLKNPILLLSRDEKIVFNYELRAFEIQSYELRDLLESLFSTHHRISSPL